MCHNLNGKLPILTDNAISNATLEQMVPDAYEKIAGSNEPIGNIEDCVLKNNRYSRRNLQGV